MAFNPGPFRIRKKEKKLPKNENPHFVTLVPTKDFTKLFNRRHCVKVRRLFDAEGGQGFRFGRMSDWHQKRKIPSLWWHPFRD